jgi:hypothetical protein
MNNSSTSNSELKLFIGKFLLRASLFLFLIAVVFSLKLPRSYYFSIPEKSSFSKLTWIENKLNQTSSLDNAVVFVGSSICMNGINDSLLNSWDSTDTYYLNFGQSHTCFAITDVLLENIVVERKLKPKKVMLCFKGDAMASLIHTMYPAAASSSKILRSAMESNTMVIPSILRHTSWNTNYLTRSFKMDDGDESKIFKGTYGFEPQGYRDSSAVEVIYKRLKPGSEANFLSIEKETQGAQMGFKTKLFLTKVDYFENVKFQRQSFINTARLLDEHNIDYDIILYPNLISARMKKPHLMADYMKHTFKSIDFSKHKIIYMTDSAFTDARIFTDMNHLNPRGAEILTSLIYEELKKSDR